MSVLDLVGLTSLMELTTGRRETIIGLIDGPVILGHPDLAGESIREIPGRLDSICAQASSIACRHGTFVAGILCGKRETLAPAICPVCTLLVRPIFAETNQINGQMPNATPHELAEAITDCIEAGARVVNLSAALSTPSSREEPELKVALDEAFRRGVIVVAAAGNQGMLGSTAILRHNGVVPVAACDLHGRPLRDSNLGSSIGRRGLTAPGAGVTSLDANGTVFTLDGTSAAAPFVTGAIALLWSVFPGATATQVRAAITQGSRRTTVVPPLLNAWRAYQVMQTGRQRAG